MQKTLQNLQANRYTQLASAWRVIENRDDQHDVCDPNRLANQFFFFRVIGITKLSQFGSLFELFQSMSFFFSIKVMFLGQIL